MKIPGALLVLGAIALVLVGVFSPQGGGADWTHSGDQGHERLAERLAGETRVRVVESSLTLLPDEAGDGDVLFLFPTHRPAGEAEIQRVDRFVKDGGLLVMAADGANAAPWSNVFGVNFKGLPVALAPGQDAECVSTDIPWRGQIHSICLPGPTAFPDLDEITDEVVFNHVSFANEDIFIDLDGDGEYGIGAQTAPGPVALQWNHGDQGGRVVAIADADVWRNYMAREEASNLEFAAALAGEVDDGTLYLDNTGAQSTFQQRTVNPWYRLVSAPATPEYGILSLIYLVFLVGAVTAPRARRLIPHEPPTDPEDQEVRRQGLPLVQKQEGDPRRVPPGARNDHAGTPSTKPGQ